VALIQRVDGEAVASVALEQTPSCLLIWRKTMTLGGGLGRG
jgi:hypothetical protein